MPKTKSKPKSKSKQSPIVLPVHPRAAKQVRPAPSPAGRAASVEVLTVEEQLQRFIDFAATCYIRSGVRLRPFTPLYPYQIELVRIYLTYATTQVLKVRQLGATETTACFMLDAARSDDAYAGVVFSLTEKDAYKVSQRVERMPSRIPDFQWAIDSLGLRRVAGGGELNFRASTKLGARGLESIHHIFMDEVGFQALAPDIYAASIPAQEMVGKYAKTFMASTIPEEGIENWFISRMAEGVPGNKDLDDMLEIARRGEYLNLTRGGESTEPIPGFVAWEDEAGVANIAVSHHAHPVYRANPNYLEEQRTKKGLTQDQVDREYGLKLPKAGGSLFNIELLTAATTGDWEEPQPYASYFASVDPNMGGSDSWALLVWRLDTYPFKLVAEYVESNQLPNYCIKRSLELIDKYKPVLVAIEKNNGGLPVWEKFVEVRPSCRFELVNTSGASKIPNTDRIALAVIDGDCIFPSDWQGLKEAKSFSRVKREAMTGKDDRILSWAVGWAWLETALSLVPRANDVARVGEMRDAYKAMEGF